MTIQDLEAIKSLTPEQASAIINKLVSIQGYLLSETPEMAWFEMGLFMENLDQKTKLKKDLDKF